MADGYARASGRVGVAMATSGPGATNMVTGIATAMMDSSPIVCITGQVGSTVIGTDAFQETDITGITLPITKHNYLVTRRRRDRSEPARGISDRGVRPARSGAGGHHQGRAAGHRANSIGKRPRREPHRQVPDFFPKQAELDEAAALINESQAPGDPGGTRHHSFRSAMREVQALAEKADIPVALTLLGLGAFPASHPLNLGMMGMHGEAWVNEAIQDADLLIALGMRFDDRVTGKLSTYAPKAKKIHVEIDRAEINKNIHVDAPLIGDLREVLAAPAAGCQARQPRGMARADQRLEERFRGARHPESSRRRAPVCRARDQCAVARDQGRGRRGYRRGPAPDVGGAVLPP